MPKAVVSTATVKKELKSAPPDGYVVLKRMTFGQKKKRQEMAIEQTMKADRRRGNNTAEMLIELAQRKVAEFEFAHCIVEHNLEDEKGELLNFRDPKTLDQLDPRVGEEIELYIAELNNFEGEEEDQAGNS